MVGSQFESKYSAHILYVLGITYKMITIMFTYISYLKY